MNKREKIELLEKANDALVHLNADLIEKVKTMESFVYEMPDDCVTGKHCEICVHKKVFHVNTTKKTWAPSYDMTRVVLCGKHLTCKNFTTEYKLEIPSMTDPYKPGVILLNNTDIVDKVIE